MIDQVGIATTMNDTKRGRFELGSKRKRQLMSEGHNGVIAEVRFNARKLFVSFAMSNERSGVE